MLRVLRGLEKKTCSRVFPSLNRPISGPVVHSYAHLVYLFIRLAFFIYDRCVGGIFGGSLSDVLEHDVFNSF